MPDAATVSKLTTWAVVGASSNPDKFGNIVFKRLLSAGKTVHPINPRLDSLGGHPCFDALADLPDVPDVVSIIVPPALGVSVVEQCAAIGVSHVWFQPGAESDAATARAQSLGLTVIHHDCVLHHI
jgi:uncharacterized protein